MKNTCLRILPLLRHLGFASVFTFAACSAGAQTVQPLIAEYTEHGEGSFEVTNTGLAASVVVLEPKSFSIRPNGVADFRPLDDSIHLELSATSFRLEPRASARVFYRATAEKAPAWFSIYASFAPAKAAKGLSVRVMLPHTVYLYQKRPLSKGAVEFKRAWFDAAAHTVTCEIANESGMAGRAEAVEAIGGHASASAGGFPLLPHAERVVSLDWTASEPPQTVEIDFERFSLKLPVSAAQ